MKEYIITEKGRRELISFTTYDYIIQYTINNNDSAVQFQIARCLLAIKHGKLKDIASNTGLPEKDVIKVLNKYESEGIVEARDV